MSGAGLLLPIARKYESCVIMKPHNYSLLLLLFGLMFIASCDNTLEPTDRNNGDYAVYGYLDLSEPVSYIRIRDLNAPFTAEATEELDAIVTLTNLDSGVSDILNSNIREFQGVFQHTYFYNQDVVPDSEYLLSLERSDGLVLDLTTLTPTKPEPLITPENPSCYQRIQINLDPLNGGTVVFRFALRPDTIDTDTNVWSRPVIIGPDDRTSESISLGITPINTARFLAGSPQNPCRFILPMGSLTMRVAHYAPGFYEKVTDDDLEIIESTRQFGAFYADTLQIPLDTSNP